MVENEYTKQLDNIIEACVGGCGKEINEGDLKLVCGKKIGKTKTIFYCEGYGCEYDTEGMSRAIAVKTAYLRGYNDAILGDKE